MSAEPTRDATPTRRPVAALRARAERVSLHTAGRTVAVAAVASALFQMMVAATTHVTDDAPIFWQWAQRVHRYGPVGIYAHLPQRFTGIPYNHPPLAAWWLWLARAVAIHTAIPFATVLRYPLILSNLLVVFVVFRLLARRVSPARAMVGGLAAALSPTLILVSAYHGNNDPWAVALVLFGAWLLVDRRMPLAAGMAVAIGISIKLPPIVAVPLLAAAAARLGRRELLRFLGGTGLVLLVVWGPPALHGSSGLLHDVIGYSGGQMVGLQWGVDRIAYLLGLPGSVAVFLYGTGRYFVVLGCTLAPVYAAWRRPLAAPALVGLSLAAFLALSYAFAPQYLVWPAAGLLLIDLPLGIAYQLLAGIFLAWTYARWAPVLFWRHRPVGFSNGQLRVALATWAVLVAAIVSGVWRITHRLGRYGWTIIEPRSAPESGSASDSEPGSRRPASAAAPPVPASTPSTP